MVNGDAESLTDLIRYGFNSIFDKLSWVDKILALDFAAKLKVDNLSSIIDLVQLSLLRARPQEILEGRLDIQGNPAQLNLSNMIQLMVVFHMNSNNHIETWNKISLLTNAIYVG
jgi:hypothetical protein